MIHRWVCGLLFWYLRRHNGEISTWQRPRDSKGRPKRKYHIVVVQEMHYLELRMDTHWLRGSGL